MKYSYTYTGYDVNIGLTIIDEGSYLHHGDERLFCICQLSLTTDTEQFLVVHHANESEVSGRRQRDSESKTNAEIKRLSESG